MKAFDGCVLNQGFGENANDIYKAYGGHPGLDTACGYGTPIYSAVTGEVCGEYTVERPANDGYVATYIFVRTALELFEFNYGHVSAQYAHLGNKVVKGQHIADEGNHGLVYQGNTLITLAMQAAGDHRGAHRHIQKRPVLEVRKRDSGKEYVRNANGYYRTPGGGFLEYALPYEQQAGCVDFSKPLFNVDLQRGDSGYPVLLLQRALGMPVALQTWSFGPQTEDAVKAFQHSNKITPESGIVGPKTRAVLNARYGQLEDPVLTPPQQQKVASDIAAVTQSIQALPEVERPYWLDVLRKALGIGG